MTVLNLIEGEPTRAADDALRAAIGQLTEVVIVGYTKDGKEFFSSSVDGGPWVVWHLERAKLKLLTIGHVEDE